MAGARAKLALLAWAALLAPAPPRARARPPVALLPYRARDVRVTQGAELSPVMADNVVLLPRRGKFAKGESFHVAFRAGLR